MNRKNQNQNSSDKILKSKYLQKQKSRFPPSSNGSSRKVMLTDLCPQQKLKIGELIKVNEARRLQILELTQQMNEIRQKFTVSHSKLIELEQYFQSKEQQCSKLVLQIEKLEQKAIENEISNNQLTQQNKLLREKIEKVNNVNKENRSCQTQQLSKADYSTQTKKNKTKNRQIQVEQAQILIQSKANSQNHTRSFDRIIKNDHKILKNSHTKSNNQINYSQNSSHRNQEDEDNLQDVEYKGSNEVLVEQRLNNLAKQWLDLKQKKVSHLKAQYQQSKAHFFRGQLDSPKEFTCEDLEIDQHEPKAKEEENDDIDENQLNNLLKSKNFSASRLLTSKGMMNESQNSRKGPSRQKNQKIKVEVKQNKIPYTVTQPRLNIGQEQYKKIEKTPIYDKYNPSQNNFYESDFMELVDSLNQ